MTPVKAIRAKCLDCCCGSFKEVKSCPCTDCPLYAYRLGKNPAYARKSPVSEKTQRNTGGLSHNGTR